MFNELLERIRHEDRRLKAFVCIAENGPDVTDPSKPLSGIAIAIKDLIDTADFPTSYGSPIYAGYRPRMDAGIVAALKEKGAFIVGKTTTTEFATWPPTPTLNPRNPAHTPGGSSAGSAAAVGAGLVPAAIGSQTKGSVIRPASFCGVVGFKPSFNRLTRSGVKMLAESLDTVGIFANSVAMTEKIYLAVTADESAPDLLASRYAFCRTPQWHDASPDARTSIEEAIDKLRTAGIAVDDLRLPDPFADIPHDTSIVHDYEMRRSLLPEFRTARAMIDPSLAAAIESASSITGEQYGRAIVRLETRRSEMAGVISAYDAVLCLAALSEAPEGLASTGSPLMNTSWTALYLPCITLPVLKGARGLPIGLQLVGKRNQDARLLKAAIHLEEACAKIL
jgi:Asp-tRNA(Asn)/Glu-tRNA(Gln) amidotransferase A subunit family amidase